jgi:hypothetical protein
MVSKDTMVFILIIIWNTKIYSVAKGRAYCSHSRLYWRLIRQGNPSGGEKWAASTTAAGFPVDNQRQDVGNTKRYLLTTIQITISVMCECVWRVEFCEMLHKNGDEPWLLIWIAATASAFKVLPQHLRVDNTLNSFYKHTGFKLKKLTSKM